jgi:hypothetical protein
MQVPLLVENHKVRAQRENGHSNQSSSCITIIITLFDICFLCLGNEDLPLAQRIHPFGIPGNLSKHFGRKHLKHVKSGKGLSCNLCKVPLSGKMQLQQHAQDIHGTVSPRHSYDRC